MAKAKRSVNFTNAIISIEDDTITEIEKETIKVYTLSKFLEGWSGVEGLNISISSSEVLSHDE